MRYCANLPADSGIRRILIIKWSAMGDVIIATALLEDIVRAFPNREIHLDTQPAWRDLHFAHDPRFQRVLTVDWRDHRHRYRRAGAADPAPVPGARCRAGGDHRPRHCRR